MRKNLWALIVDTKIAERYYWHYIDRSKRYDRIVSGICLLTSAASISAWYVWKSIPGLWAFIAGAAQVVSTLKPLLPFAKRATAATYVQQDVQKLLIEMESAWNRYGDDASDKRIGELWENFSQKYRQIEERFAPPDLFPQNTRIHNIAQHEAQIYFFNHYGCESGREGGD